jgi:Histidine kinase-, DNA gyrase B-, and HSP90-like ATPase
MVSYRTVQNIPHAERAMRGMARAGYVPQTALADLIDNSIAAGATRVEISVEQRVNGGDVVYISDNGKGMTGAELARAMQYGSGADMANTKLSVYGLGLKLASTEISPSGFTVVSRGSDGIVNSASWQMEDQSANPWSMRIWDGTAPSPLHQEKLDSIAPSGGTGTVVIWDHAVLSGADFYKKEAKGGADATLKRITNRIREHLALTFHRWIEGTVEDAQQIEIVFDGELLKAWNPFDERWRDPNTEGKPKQFIVKDRASGAQDLVSYITPYVMRNDLSAAESKEARRQLEFQGIYVYRMDRLVQAPGWLDFYPSRHNDRNGLRFALDLHSELIDEMQLDVKKSSVQMPGYVTNGLSPFIAQFAEEERRKSNKKTVKNNIALTPQEILRGASDSVKQVAQSVGEPIFDELSPQLVLVHNGSGLHEHRVIKLPLSASKELRIELVNDLDHGILWDTNYDQDNHVRIRVNQSHNFYQRVMLPFSQDSLAWEGFMNILWAFSRAEFEAARGDSAQFADMRMDMSWTLNKFAESKPVFDLAAHDADE